MIFKYSLINSDEAVNSYEAQSAKLKGERKKLKAQSSRLKARRRGCWKAKTGALGPVHFRGDVNRWNLECGIWEGRDALPGLAGWCRFGGRIFSLIAGWSRAVTCPSLLKSGR